MTKNENERLLNSALEIGRRMMQYGAEGRRVEDTITRICTAYKCTKCEVFALLAMIIVSITDEDGNHYTQTARVLTVSNDLGKLEDLNAEARQICAYKPPVEDIEKFLDQEQKPTKSPAFEILGYILAAAGFSLFFGGNLNDFISTAIVASFVYVLDHCLQLKNENRLMYTTVSCFLCGCLAIILVHFGIGSQIDVIVIGTIMVFIPGLAFTNSIKEMFHRDILCGLYRLVEALLITGAISLGFATSFAMLGGLLL